MQTAARFPVNTTVAKGRLRNAHWGWRLSDKGHRLGDSTPSLSQGFACFLDCNIYPEAFWSFSLVIKAARLTHYPQYIKEKSRST